jgi:hypothetical protein
MIGANWACSIDAVIDGRAEAGTCLDDAEAGRDENPGSPIARRPGERPAGRRSRRRHRQVARRPRSARSS